MEYIKPKDKLLSPEYIEGHFVGWNSAMEIWAKRFEEEKARFQSRLTAETKRADEAEAAISILKNKLKKQLAKNSSCDEFGGPIARLRED